MKVSIPAPDMVPQKMTEEKFTEDKFTEEKFTKEKCPQGLRILDEREY